MAGAGGKDNKITRFGKVGVLAGGPSNERAISLESGKAVYKALKEAGCDAALLDISEDPIKDVKKSGIGTAFIALHGRFGEDGTVQGLLEKIGIPYTGSGPEASRLALDKIASRRRFEKNRIPVPLYQIFENSSRLSVKLNFPVVVKPQFEGSSIGLSVVDGPGGLEKAFEKAFRCGDRIIVEEFIKGREITVGILDESPLPPVEIVPKGRCYDYFAKYVSPDTRYLVPASLEGPVYKRAQELGLMAHNTLGCRSFSRVDMILGEDSRFYVLEVNSIPGLTGRSLLPKAAASTGVSFRDLCIKILERAQEKIINGGEKWTRERKKILCQKR